MTLEGQRPTQITPENPHSPASPELVQETAGRIQIFAYSRSLFDARLLYPYPSSKKPNSTEIEILKSEGSDVWQELRNGIPAEVLIFEERDLEVDEDRDPIRNYKIILGQTKHGGDAGLKESMDEISISPDDLFHDYKIYSDGRVTRRSKFAKDYDPNPPHDPWDREMRHLPLRPIERVPEYEVPITESDVAELDAAMNRFEEMSREGRLLVQDVHREVSYYI